MNTISLHIEKERVDNNPTWHTTITLNREHPIYQGHFPGHPIVPGVCMLQLVRECAQEILQQPLQYTEIASCKFLSAINPLDTTLLEFKITFPIDESGQLRLLAEGKTNGDCFLKLKATLSLYTPITE